MKFTLPAALVFVTSALATCSYSETSSPFSILLSSQPNCDGSTFETDQGYSEPCACTPVPSELVGNVSSIVTQTSSTGQVLLFLDVHCSGPPNSTHSGQWMDSDVTGPLKYLQAFSFCGGASTPQ
ncbi:uncharacterized protein EDB91DRAFT_699484 [Suillus paluster]|uniref:uncharacterized protein n=1 Tax=Suillus paluster TaxID=48578 RepID=UPI001B87BFBC|nr:uncharacterized protein EDB91DRAFT_699484 [Suillus paluster]KAG1750634.1 hypothetical protein EDB91DRAFT_699484 [Suillus paluster]